MNAKNRLNVLERRAGVTPPALVVLATNGELSPENKAAVAIAEEEGREIIIYNNVVSDAVDNSE